MKNSKLEEKVLIAGFGGQGIMLLGKIIAEAAVLENKNVTYIRSYGAEMRGGTAHCSIKLSKKEIASPVFDNATAAIIMNQPSLEKFKNRFTKESIVIANGSLIKINPKIKGVKLYFYPLNEMANFLGDIRVANIIALGKLLKKYSLIKKDSVIKILREYFKSNPHILELNLEAFALGWKKN